MLFSGSSHQRFPLLPAFAALYADPSENSWSWSHHDDDVQKLGFSLLLFSRVTPHGGRLRSPRMLLFRKSAVSTDLCDVFMQLWWNIQTSCVSQEEQDNMSSCCLTLAGPLVKQISIKTGLNKHDPPLLAELIVLHCDTWMIRHRFLLSLALRSQLPVCVRLNNNLTNSIVCHISSSQVKQWRFKVTGRENRAAFLIPLSSEYLPESLTPQHPSLLISQTETDASPPFFSLSLNTCFLFIISWLGASSSRENSYLLNIRGRNSGESIFCARADKHKTQSEGERKTEQRRRGPHPLIPAVMDSRSKSVGTVLCKLRRHPGMALMIMWRCEWCLWVPRRPTRASLFLFLPNAPEWIQSDPLDTPSSSMLPPKPIHSSPRQHPPPQKKWERKDVSDLNNYPQQLNSTCKWRL